MGFGLGAGERARVLVHGASPGSIGGARSEVVGPWVQRPGVGGRLALGAARLRGDGWGLVVVTGASRGASGVGLAG